MSESVARMRDEVARGLAAPHKTLSPKFFYDALGSKLFEAITYTDAYYPTRCEMQILTAHGADIARAIGPAVALVELGSGQSTKVPLLLSHLPDVRAYVPVDIDAATLTEAARRLRRQFPGLTVVPVAADLSGPWALPDLPEHARTVVFYPGSTLGNLDPAHATAFLDDLGRRLAPGDGLVLGIDLEKDPAVLEAAYDDPAGVTAAFNRNMLVHLNRVVGTDFAPRRFAHEAFWNADAHRIEMHLRSLGPQVVHLGPHAFAFDDGETLHTERSYKYTRERVDALTAHAGFARQAWWTDPQGWFGVGAYVRTSEPTP